MSKITNDVPRELLELAQEAFSLGLHKVSLGFMYLGADFVSPIEWALWLEKREGGPEKPRSYVTVTAARNDEEGPTAYMPSDSGDWREASYWDVERIREWLREPLESSDKHVQAWSPIVAPVSVRYWSNLHDGEEQEFFSIEDSRPVQLSEAQATELLTCNAPWFVRVALFDEEQEEWLHYPEALQPEERTIALDVTKSALSV